MKRLFTMMSLWVLASMILTACGGGAATQAPAPTEAPAATEMPATEMPATEAPATQPAAAGECTDSIGCVDIAPGDPIHLAWALTVSGATAPLGEDARGGVEIAIDDKGGELLGHPIELSGEDTLCNAEGGQAAGTKLAADPTIVAIVGTTCSSEARAAMPLIFEAGMVMISPSNTNPDLTNPEHPDHYKGYFRTAHNDLYQGRVAAEYAFNELGLTKAATIHDGSPYAQSLQEVFAKVFTELGGTITAQEAINVGDTDMKPVLTSIATGAPEIIYFPIFEPEGDLVAQQIKEVSGLENVVSMGADGLFADSFPEATGDAAAGMYLSGPYLDPAISSYAEFLQKWTDKFGGQPPSGYHAFAYDATNMIFAAIESVAVVDADGTVHIGRQALRDAMYATTDFPGISGTLSCDNDNPDSEVVEEGDCATGKALAIYQIGEEEVGGNWPPPVVWTPNQ